MRKRTVILKGGCIAARKPVSKKENSKMFPKNEEKDRRKRPEGRASMGVKGETQRLSPMEKGSETIHVEKRGKERRSGFSLGGANCCGGGKART